MTAVGEQAPAGRRWGATLVALVGCASALAWSETFDAAATLPLVVAAVAPALVAIVAGGGRSLAASGAVSTLALLGLLTFVADQPMPSAVLVSLAHSWDRILTTTLDVPVDDGRLVGPVACVWVATAAGTEMALRLRRRPAAAVLPPLGALVVALPFGAAPATGVTWLATGALSLSLAFVAGVSSVPAAGGTVVRSREGTGLQGRLPRLPSRRAAGGVVLIVVTATAGLAAASLIPSPRDDPWDPRAARRPPMSAVAAIDPLSMLAGWALDPDDTVLFTATSVGDRRGEPDRWQLAVVDTYDPASGWSSHAGYVAVGTRVPAAPPEYGPVSSQVVEHDITIAGLAGAWLPTAGRPTAVGGLDAYADPATATLVTPAGLSTGLRYDLTSSPGRASGCTDQDVAAAPDGPAAPVPAELVEYSEAVTREAATACARARALEDYLNGDDFEFDADARSGTNLERIVELLQPGGDPGLGTSEQFATAYALLARAEGLDSRVVVGFRPRDVEAGVTRVHASDALAWPEVRFEGIGWVPFDPTPGEGDAAPKPEATAPESSATTTTSAPGGDEGEAPPTTTAVDDPDGKSRVGGRQGESAGAARTVVGGVALLAAGLAVAAALVRVARGTRRRRRRRSEAPADRVVGAWRQSLVDLRSTGVEPRANFTATDYVVTVSSSLGGTAADDLELVAALANDAWFGGDVSDSDATAAWAAADRLSQTLAARRSRLAAVGYAIDLRAIARS